MPTLTPKLCLHEDVMPEALAWEIYTSPQHFWVAF